MSNDNSEETVMSSLQCQIDCLAIGSSRCSMCRISTVARSLLSRAWRHFSSAAD